MLSNVKTNDYLIVKMAGEDDTFFGKVIDRSIWYNSLIITILYYRGFEVQYTERGKRISDPRWSITEVQIIDETQYKLITSG